MRNLLFFFCLGTLIFSLSCRKDFDTVPSSGKLVFSKDTVYLDTIFSNIGSSTYNLKVYNKSNRDINIPTIKLGKGENSGYRLNVDGIPGKTFNDIPVLAKDSLYIFVETTIDYNQVTNPIYTDSIVFGQGEFLQDVKLVTLVQDAHFLYPNKNTSGLIETISLGIDQEGKEIEINGFYIDKNTTWNNKKPYVIYGYASLTENHTLTIEAGAKIHFHANSGLIVNKNATLKIEGELNKEVIIEGDRLEPSFSEIPGQWGTIWLRAGSKDHDINYAIIKNGSAGIIMDSIGNNTSPTLSIKNTQIYNSAAYGILGRETHIEGENLVINNSGLSSLVCSIGGTYNFTHSTFTNYWSNGLRQFPAVLINNYFSYLDENNNTKNEPRDLVAANFNNCIIYGNENIEFLLDKEEGALFNYNFKNCLIHFDDFNDNYDENPLFDFSDTSKYQNNIFNEDPHFKNIELNQFIIGEKSAGKNKADMNSALLIPLDILKENRTVNPDIGAYQHIIFENN